MGFRVDRVAVKLTVYREFFGPLEISFSFAPDKPFDFDLDPLVAALLEKNSALLKQAAESDDKADPMIFL